MVDRISDVEESPEYITSNSRILFWPHVGIIRDGCECF